MPREVLQLHASHSKLLPCLAGDIPAGTVTEGLAVGAWYPIHQGRLHHGRVDVDLGLPLHLEDILHTDHLLLGVVPLGAGHSTARAPVGRPAITAASSSDHFRDLARDRLASWHC
jgi:hypothetical protein